MRLIQLIITIFAIAGRLLVLAKPIPNWKAGGIAVPLTRRSSFLNDKCIDLDVISSHGIMVEEKIRSGLKNYEMNMGTTHPFAVKRNDSGLRTRGASIPLTTFQNIMWNGEISIGTPPKTLKVYIDTGSADMWVLQTGCSGISADRDLWDPNSSESAKKQQPFQLKYADGSIVAGDRFTDNVTIAGFTADPQIFGSVTSYTSHLTDKENTDGLLGLAFPSISAFRASPLLVSLIEQNGLLNPIFSLKLSSSGAELYVGGANNLLYNGAITYTRVTDSGFWQVSVDDVRVNGNPILVDVPAIFDTGSSYIFGDWNRVSELYGSIGAKVKEYKGFGFYYLPCDSFPTMGFTLGGKTFEVPPEALRLRQINKGSPYCLSALVGWHASSRFWHIGVPFMQSVYSVFDYGTKEVGFAELA